MMDIPLDMKMSVLDYIVDKEYLLEHSIDKMQFHLINSEWNCAFQNVLKQHNMRLFKNNKRNDLFNVIQCGNSFFDDIFKCNQLFFESDPDHRYTSDQNIFKHIYPRSRKILFNFLIERSKINDLEWLKFVEHETEAFYWKLLEENIHFIQYIKKQNEQMCLYVVRKNGALLKHVHRQTKHICMEAVKNFAFSLVDVVDKSRDICMEAINKCGMAICFIVHTDNEICLQAVKQNGLAVWYVHNRTPEICMEAVKQNGKAIEYIGENMQTFEMCMCAVKQNMDNMQHVKSDSIKERILNELQL